MSEYLGSANSAEHMFEPFVFNVRKYVVVHLSSFTNYTGKMKEVENHL